MGWAVLIGLALVTALLLWLIGFPRRLWTVAAAGLMLGAAGYAWQGNPSLAGHPVQSESKKGEIDPGFIELRESIFGKFGTHFYTNSMAADAMIREGRPDLAVKVWLGATRKQPKDAALWSGLGLALSENDAGHVSPAAQLAFDRAIALSPQHPGPSFYYGLALVREGRFEDAKKWWERAVRLTPETMSYSDDLRGRLYLLERLIEAQKAQGAAEAAGAPHAGQSGTAPLPAGEATPAPAADGTEQAK